MNDPLFIKLHTKANRIEGIFKHLDTDLSAKDKAMGTEDVDFWKSQVAGLSLDRADMEFYKKHSQLLLLVLKITSRTKLTLQTLKEKLRKPSKYNTNSLYGVSLKLMTLDQICLPYAQNIIRMVSQLKHDVSVLTADVTGRDVEPIFDAGELRDNSALSRSLANEDREDAAAEALQMDLQRLKLSQAAGSAPSSAVSTPVKAKSSTSFGDSLSPIAKASPAKHTE